MKVIIFLVIFLLNINVASSIDYSGLSKADICSNELIKRWSERMKKEKGMKLAIIGGSENDGITSLAVGFDLKIQVNREEARKLIINCSQDFLKEINSDQLLRPFLKFFPFTPKNIEVKIFCIDETGKEIYEPYIGVIACDNGILNYNINAHNCYGYKEELSETFEEGLSILANEKINE